MAESIGESAGLVDTCRGLRRVVVIGGGISGLSAAHAVREWAAQDGSPLQLRLFEATARLGGHVRTESVGDVLIEGGADSLVAQKPAGEQLCRRLGLGDDLVRLDGSRSSIQVVHGGRLLDLPSGFLMLAPTRLGSLLRSPLFSWRGKARMLCEPWVPARAAEYEDESLRSFVTRRLGREVFERVAEPIVGGLYTADARRLSLAMTMPRFLELERRQGSVIRGLRRAARKRGRPGGGFVWLRRGMTSLIDRLADQFEPEEIRLRQPIDKLVHDPSSNRWRVEADGGNWVEADAVILACPAFAAARLLRSQDERLARELARLRYASCATVHLLYRRDQLSEPLGSHGFFVPRTAGLPLRACSYASVKFHDRVPRDKVLLRAFMGGALDEELVERGDDQLVELARRTLTDLLRLQGRPILCTVHRHRDSMPQFDVGDGRRIRTIIERLEQRPGMFLAGSAMGAIGLPDCISSGERAARQVARFLAGNARNLQMAG